MVSIQNLEGRVSKKRFYSTRAVLGYIPPVARANQHRFNHFGRYLSDRRALQMLPCWPRPMAYILRSPSDDEIFDTLRGVKYGINGIFTEYVMMNTHSRRRNMMWSAAAAGRLKGADGGEVKCIPLVLLCTDTYRQFAWSPPAEIFERFFNWPAETLTSATRIGIEIFTKNFSGRWEPWDESAGVAHFGFGKVGSLINQSGMRLYGIYHGETKAEVARKVREARAKLVPFQRSHASFTYYEDNLPLIILPPRQT